MLATLTNKAVLAPVGLSVVLVIIASSSGFFNFFLLFVTNFTGTSVNENLLMVESAIKIAGALAGLLIGPKIGHKMLLLLGKFNIAILNF